MMAIFETPMVVDGIPEGARVTRRIIGLRSGTVELEERGAGSVVYAGSISKRPDMKPDAVYHAPASGGELLRDWGVVSHGLFRANSVFPPIRDRVRAIAGEIASAGETEVKRGWYPSDLCLYLRRWEGRGAAQLREIRPERIANLDMGSFERQHAELVAELAAYSVCDGRLFGRLDHPFYGVAIADGAVRISIHTEPMDEVFSARSGCVAAFGLDRERAALEFAEELAARSGRNVVPYGAEVELARPEYFALDGDRCQFHLTGRRLMARLSDVLGKYRALDALLGVPLELVGKAQALGAALAGRDSPEGVAVLEAAINDCIDFDGARGSSYFTNPGDIVLSTVVDLWQDRVVELAPDASPPASQGA